MVSHGNDLYDQPTHAINNDEWKAVKMNAAVRRRDRLPPMGRFSNSLDSAMYIAQEVQGLLRRRFSIPALCRFNFPRGRR